eukprot:1851501-Pyramimonas_sp.AAC.1
MPPSSWPLPIVADRRGMRQGMCFCSSSVHQRTQTPDVDFFHNIDPQRSGPLPRDQYSPEAW